MKFSHWMAIGWSLCALSAAQAAPVVLVLTNVGELKPAGAEALVTGFYLSEAAHPYAVLRAAGHEVVLASPKGGFAPLDPKSLDLKDPLNAEFWKAHGAEQQGRQGVANTRSLADLKPAEVAGVFFAGGHGTMGDFPDPAVVGSFIAKVDAAGGVIAAVCHGPSALVGAKGVDGKPLVAGRKVAVFTNAEEQAVGLTEVVPFLLQDELSKAGAQVVLAANFAENAVRDGRLVTGQNPASATLTARLMVEALAKKP
ncbi:MAG TPA: type 1 glutamine amidotransferase domain-containing protein [Luteolibacter sp.]|nr:type 1 glutamine amidotransferase domain-containing protein [Luteolibacter sp.]